MCKLGFLIINNNHDKVVNMNMSAYVLTTVGLQLYDSLKCRVSLDAIKEIAKNIKNNYRDVDVSLRRIANIDDNGMAIETNEVISID